MKCNASLRACSTFAVQSIEIDSALQFEQERFPLHQLYHSKADQSSPVPGKSYSESNIRNKNRSLIWYTFCSIRNENTQGGEVLPYQEVRGAWTSHQVWRQNLGQGPAKFPK